MKARNYPNMSKQLIKIFCLFNFTLLIIPQSAFSAVTVIDDEKNEVKLLQPAKRIISLAPHITESLYAAGAGKKIIATVSYSDYPEEAKQIPLVGGYPSLDLEKIISLKPDLVIAWSSGNKKNQVEKLRKFGLTVFMSEPRHPQDIAKTIQRFGVMAGTTVIASQAADKFLQHYESLKNNYSTKTKVKVFYQIWNKPIMTISRQHLISDIIELCGGENVFANIQTMTPRISLEAVLAEKPDSIISGGMGKARPEWLDEWKKWPDLPAVKNEHLYFIEPSLMQRVGPRILQGADKLCNFLDEARTH